MQVKNNLTVTKEQSQALVQWTPEQIDLIKKTVAKGATDDELKLFLYRCKKMELDPLKPGQIHFVKYGTSPGTIIVGIDGFRSKASRTGKLTGVKRGAIRDESGKLLGAWAEVYRRDWIHPARDEVPLNEYNTSKGNWQKMPETMIKKVAEVAALRMAFPDDLGGLYSQEEIDQAQPLTPENVPATPPIPHDIPASAVEDSVVDEFIAVYKDGVELFDPDWYKGFLKNANGESPTIEQITKWKSPKQIAWLRSAVIAMKRELNASLAGGQEPEAV